ncbi:DUF3376 domain-containing protein [Winogradskya humida]|uniref:PNPLA domain-containing protein n=1 Tax=Winogradskya humida TaxID=113566 RepID=A0ABQ4A0S2_9ACTN|nr:DUF3376 domain-containing protein [Actinoplanes humidus]GIE24455.1 hypothetical protein Ahu01nite_075570 [Actinoplanes humidus]
MARTQVRLGLVFQGGVSLAVWMSGVAHEIDLLRRAGAPDRPGPPTDGGDCDGDCGGDEALCRWRALCNRLDVDVIVDVVSGTSAGGLNGAFLACAAAAGNPLPQLRNLWVDAAQLQRGKLLRPAGGEPVPSLLDGDFFAGQIQDVLTTALEEGGRKVGHPVTLLTTATALGEQTMAWADCTGDEFGVADHRRVYSFRYDPASVRFTPQEGFTAGAPSQFTKDSIPVLTRAARATAGFPAAFTPVAERDAGADLSGHRVRGGNDNGVLIDGGVLDNTPFEPLLEEIGRRTVEGDWRRIIGYVTANDGLADSTVDTGTPTAGTKKAVAQGWFPVLTSALRMASETSFRNGVEALAQRSLDAQGGSGTESAFTDALSDPERMGAAAEALYTRYRHQRVASGALDACLARDARGAIRPVCTPSLADVDPDAAPLWVPPAALADAFELALQGDWRWGTAVADRTVRLLIRHLRVTGADMAALAGLSEVLTRVIAVRDHLTGRIAQAPSNDSAALVQAVNEASETSGSSQVLGDLMRRAALAYDAGRADEVLRAALVVEVVSHAVAGPHAFSRTPRFDVVRMGPDVESPVVPGNPDRRPLGSWKLYGTQLGHFGAFGEADWRRHDFLWGRLDGAAHLIRALARVSGSPLREPATAATWTTTVQDMVLAQEDTTAEDLNASLRTVSGLDAKATLDAMRHTEPGRRAIADTVTDTLRMLRTGGQGVPSALTAAGGWAWLILGPRPPLRSWTAVWKLPLWAATAFWPRHRFWHRVRELSSPSPQEAELSQVPVEHGPSTPSAHRARKQAEDLVRLETLGHHPQTKIAAEVDDRSHDDRAGGVHGQVNESAPADL